jgi:hypothetical protein
VLSPRLIAMDGLGGGPRLVAVRGLWPAAAPVEPHHPDYSGGLRHRRRRRREEDEAILLALLR